MLAQTALVQDLGSEQTFPRIFACSLIYVQGFIGTSGLYVYLGVFMMYKYDHQTRQLVLPSPKHVGYDEACLSSR